MSTPITQIDRLDDTNYDSWFIQMRSVLIHSGFWKIVSGQVKLDLKLEGSEKELWESNDEKALASICLGVKPTQLVYIKNCKTSNEAWKKLQEVHMPRGPLQKVSLYKRLINLSMVDGANVVQHINEFTEISEKLAESGIQIQEELLVIMLLSSLPKEYDNFVIAMETRDQLPDFQLIKQKLSEEGKRRKERDINDNSTNPQQQAFIARSPHTKRYNNNKKFNGKCFLCGVSGHFASKCEKKKKNNNTQAMTMLAAADTSCLNLRKWYVDSGATSHMCNDRSKFVSFQKHNEIIALAGNNYINAIGKGDVLIHHNNFEIILQNVLFSPELQANFISVNKAVDCGLNVKFDANGAVVQREDRTIVLNALRRDNMFVATDSATERNYAVNNISKVWHNRYGHLNYKSLHDLSNKKMVKGMNVNKNKNYQTNCKTCMLSKIHVLSFPKVSETITKELLEVVHSDVCGPFRIKSVGGAKYFVTFIDDKSRRIFVYFMKNKSEVFDKFKIYKAQVENQTGCKIKTFRTDNGREYVNSSFESYLTVEGISRQLTVPYTPQQNGVAERANRTLIEMARSMMVHAGVKEYLWAEAISTAVYIRNRCPTVQLGNKTPYEVWSGIKPNVQHLKTFGSIAIGLNKSANNSKFEAKGKQYIMVGYSNTSKAYRLFDIKTHKVIELRDVLFDENFLDEENININDNIETTAKAEDYLTLYFEENNNNFNLTDEVDDDVNLENELNDDVTDADEVNDDVNRADDVDSDGQPSVRVHVLDDSFNTADDDTDSDNVNKKEEMIGPGRPKIIRSGKPGRPKRQYNIKQQTSELCAAIDENIPQTVEEAFSGEKKHVWKKAMEEEFFALKKNKTWSLVDLPKGHKAIPCKWVYALKRNVNGEIERYKARLVAKGCSQRFGIDFKETFSPVVRYSTIRLLLALAVKNNMHLHQIDVSSAYLNSNLQDEIYMQQPKNFIYDKSPEKVLRLHKAIYGLKQSGKEWNSKLDSVLRKMNFVPCNTEPCLYKTMKNDFLVLIAVYVDDLIIACSDITTIKNVKKQIAGEFAVSDKGVLNHFLGMEVEREGETGMIKLSQTQYIRDVLKQYGMEQCKSVAVPLEAGYQVHCDANCKKSNQQEYQSLVGTLMYLAISTRPDILHSVSKMAQRNADPHEEHMTKLKHILRYLAGSINLKLFYKADSGGLEGFVDADWGGNALDRKSYTGFTFFFDGCPISWESRKQSSVALSSTEAEYMAASDAAKEAIYLKRLLKEISAWDGGPVTLHIDNQGAQKLAENPVYHKRSKHIDIKFHHIRDLVQNQEVKLVYCPTADMIADILTKNLPRVKHCNFVNLIKLN